jgi:hypothetical protein
MKYFSEGSAAAIITPERLHDLIDSMVGQMGKLDRVLIVPPDFTRYPSGAGEITCRL